MAHIVFYFSGTGNSLNAAKIIAGELGGGEVVSMAGPGPRVLTRAYDTIGFVFPVYFWGLPKKVIEFAGSLDLGGNKGAYLYAVATYGGMAGNAVHQLDQLLLDRQGIGLNYGKKLRMFANYVLMYNMGKNADKAAKRSAAKLVPIVAAIKGRKTNRTGKWTNVFKSLNGDFVKAAPDTDKDYLVGDGCTGCGICEKVCPVQNIAMVDRRPQFSHRCERCVACIQYCPQKAINYKNMTQRRRRYTHPAIDYKELSERNRR